MISDRINCKICTLEPQFIQFKMKRFLIILAAATFFSCSKESDYSPNTYSSESTIYSDSDEVAFRQILFMLSPYTKVSGEKKYIVAPVISNIIVKVNDSNWGTFQSIKLDSSHVAKALSGDYYTTDKILKYSVIAGFQAEKDTLTLAGEYSDLLNNYLTLTPGMYIIDIQSFDITRSNGQIETVYPLISVPLEVEKDVSSAFIGEFEVELLD